MAGTVTRWPPWRQHHIWHRQLLHAVAYPVSFVFQWPLSGQPQFWHASPGGHGANPPCFLHRARLRFTSSVRVTWRFLDHCFCGALPARCLAVLVCPVDVLPFAAGARVRRHPLTAAAFAFDGLHIRAAVIANSTAQAAATAIITDRRATWHR